MSLSNWEDTRLDTHTKQKQKQVLLCIFQCGRNKNKQWFVGTHVKNQSVLTDE